MAKQKKKDEAWWGILALILGIFSLILCWVPFVGFILSIATIIISGIGLKKVEANRGLVITGLVLGILALLIAIVISIITLIGIALFSLSVKSSMEKITEEELGAARIACRYKDIESFCTEPYQLYDQKTGEYKDVMCYDSPLNVKLEVGNKTINSRIDCENEGYFLE